MKPSTTWEERFDETFNSDDLHVSGRAKWFDFIAQELSNQRHQLISELEVMKQELPAIKWKSDHEENVVKASYNQALEDIKSKLELEE